MFRYRIYRRPWRVAAVVLGSFLTLAVLGGGSTLEAAGWARYSWLTGIAGYESDRVFDPTLGVFAVPGGSFLDLTPGLTLSRRFDNQTRVTLNGQFTWERFQNSVNRTVLSVVAAGDVRRQVRGPFQLRATLGANYYSDSGQESVNRLSSGLKGAAGFIRSRWYLELVGNLQGRRYQNLTVQNDAGALVTYAEATFALAVEGAVQPTGSTVLSGQLTRQTTDARDALFDSESWLVQGSARVRVLRSSWLSANLFLQDRRFTLRDPGIDKDSYSQIGLGVEHLLNGSLELGVRYIFARYTQTNGTDEDFHRISAGVTWWIGRSPRQAPPIQLPRPVPGDGSASRVSESYLFRVHAPGATRVELVADFNRWQSGRNALRSVGDGWWELTLTLAPGTYQYAYLVDGKMMTPPDAEVTVDDGFGGRNGLLQLLPDGS